MHIMCSSEIDSYDGYDTIKYYMTYPWKKKRRLSHIVCRVKMFGSIVGRAKSVWITQASKRINYAPSTITLASPILQLRMVGSYVYPPVGFETITSIPKSYSYFSWRNVSWGLVIGCCVNKFFGGHQSRWSFGYITILIIDINIKASVCSWISPSFTTHSTSLLRRQFGATIMTTRHRIVSVLTLYHFGSLGWLMIDCSIFRINRPFSGPDGDYIGAPRKENYPIAQRAVYTGYKKCHGIKVQTILLPNGISCLYGPTSARVPDIGPTGILEMSGLDHFLQQAQQNNNTPYYAFGDGVYNSNALRRKFVYLCLLPFFWYEFLIPLPYL